MEHFGHVTSTTTPLILPPSSTVKCSTPLVIGGRGPSGYTAPNRDIP